MTEELTDEDIDKIHEEATDAAEFSWSGKFAKCPYLKDSQEYEIWQFAFRQQWWKNNS